MSVKKIVEATPHQKLQDLLRRILNRCFGAAGLAEGTNANTIQIAAAVDYCIDGVVYLKAITDNIAMTALPVQAISTFCKYLVSIDAAGTVTLTQGNIAATAALALVPSLPADSAPLGYVQVATDAATTFTSGTTDLGAAGITDTYVNLSSVVTND
jgi:hypothetical protein